MPYPLRIRFDGLCALLPSAEIAAGRRLDWVSFFLVDTENKGYPAHRPVLNFELSDYTGMVHVAEDTPPKVQWPLRDVDVFFDFTSQDSSDIDPAFGKARGEKPNPNDIEEATDLFWLPRLDEALSRREAIRRGLSVYGKDLATDCLKPVPAGDLVVARIHLRRGRLRVFDHVKVNEQIAVSQFTPTEEGNPLRQALSAGVGVDVRSVQTSVIVKFKRFGSGDFEKLSLGSESRTRRLNIEFSNFCGDGCYGQEGGTTRDEDFELFYLLNGVPKDGLRGLPAPCPVRFRTSRYGEGGTVFKRCTESQLTPLASAQSDTYKAEVIEGLSRETFK